MNCANVADGGSGRNSSWLGAGASQRRENVRTHSEVVDGIWPWGQWPGSRRLVG